VRRINNRWQDAEKESQLERPPREFVP